MHKKREEDIKNAIHFHFGKPSQITITFEDVEDNYFDIAIDPQTQSQLEFAYSELIKNQNQCDHFKTIRLNDRFKTYYNGVLPPEKLVYKYATLKFITLPNIFDSKNFREIL